MSFVKEILRELLIFSRIDLTTNLKYDRLTREILKSNLKPNFNCIDIGCHKGEILDLIFKYAPNGQHFGFEPIPYLYQNLKERFSGRATILPYALSNENGEITFQLVKNAPAYSGIKRRKYAIENPEIEEINVEQQMLDNVIDRSIPIQFVKIDVEGAEFGVLKGAKELLKRNKPIVLFECGKGASDYYGTSPLELYTFVNEEIGLNIYTLNGYIKGNKGLTGAQFVEYFESNAEYYFVAAPQVVS